MQIVVHTDGGARGNPGPAAIGVVVEIEPISQSRGKTIAAFGKRIGETTNNVAEYQAVLEALAWLKNYPISKLSNYPIIQFHLDSKLVVNQLNGSFKVKDPNLRELLTKIRILENEVGGEIHYHLVPREYNRRADFLVNQALDNP